MRKKGEKSGKDSGSWEDDFGVRTRESERERERGEDRRTPRPKLTNPRTPP